MLYPFSLSSLSPFCLIECRGPCVGVSRPAYNVTWCKLLPLFSSLLCLCPSVCVCVSVCLSPIRKHLAEQMWCRFKGTCDLEQLFRCLIQTQGICLLLTPALCTLVCCLLLVMIWRHVNLLALHELFLG